MKTTPTTQLFRSYRINYGLTQYELAFAMGTSRGHIANIEQGRTIPSDETVDRFATVVRTTRMLA